MKTDPKRYCGIVFIGGGSSWYYAPTPETAAKKAAKLAKSDWGKLFKFARKQEFKVPIYDMKDHAGWFATAGGEVTSTTTNKPIPLHSVITVSV